jgi:hypothetical protein
LFQQLEISKGFPKEQQLRYNLITAFDVIHDIADPLATLGAIPSRTKARWEHTFGWKSTLSID